MLNSLATTVVTPRTPHQYLGRTSGPSLSGTDFRFPPMGEKIEKTTSITSIQVNFNVTTPTDSRVTLRFSHPKNHTEQLGDFETHAGKPQSILYVKNFENSTRSFILYAGDLASVGLVSNSSYMWIDTDSTIWLTLREANVVPPGNIWTQYEQESVLSFLGAFAASAGSSLLVAPILKRRSGRLRRASASHPSSSALSNSSDSISHPAKSHLWFDHRLESLPLPRSARLTIVESSRLVAWR